VNSEVCINLENSARRVYIDGKAIHRSTDLHGKLAVVIFSPDDTAMVKLGPETRRRFLDRSLYTSNIGFLQDYHCYYRNLKQRNSLLKNNQTEGLDIWTEQMATSGARLMKHRQRYTAKINTLLQNHYKQIAGQSENVEICYLPDLTPTTDENMNEHLLKAFREHQEYDIRSKTTGRGPHRDDLGFILQERSLKKFGSQGQQRSYILALKMAELEYLHETFGEMPVLLLDDIASELDRERMSKLLRYIRQKEIQVVITTTDINPFLPMIEKDSVLMKVEEGRLIKEGNRIS
jgi:DNA replication and repair protein RecF